MFLLKLSCLESKDVSLRSKIQHNRKDISMAQFEFRNHFHISYVLLLFLFLNLNSVTLLYYFNKTESSRNVKRVLEGVCSNVVEATGEPG